MSVVPILVCVCESDEADGTVLGCGICSFSDMLSVCLHAAMTGTHTLSTSRCQKGIVWDKDHAAPAGVQVPCTSLNWVYSTPITLCFISGHETITELLFLIHWRSCSQSCQSHDHYGQSLRRNSSSLGKKCTDSPACCIGGIHGPALQNNGGLTIMSLE